MDRLDEWLVRENFFESRTKAKRFILENGILVNNKLIVKPSYRVKHSDMVNIDDESYQSFTKPRGYRKLGKISSDPRFPPFNDQDRCLDIGASAGGFSLYLLEKGVKSVLAMEISDDFESYLKEIQLTWSNFTYIITNFFDTDLEKIGKFNTILVDLTVDPSFLLSKIDSFIKLIQPGEKAKLLLTLKLGKVSKPESVIEETEKSIIDIDGLKNFIWFDSLEDKKERLLLLQFGE